MKKLTKNIYKEIKKTVRKTAHILQCICNFGTHLAPRPRYYSDVFKEVLLD